MATAVDVPGQGPALQTPKGRVGEYAGPYRLLETLGKGGLATVKLGLNSSNGAKVAVKIIDKEKLANPREQVSMAREITIMKLLTHPNILRLHDIYENADKIFLILDIYEGGDLYTHLTSHGAMRPSEALLLFRQIIEGIEFCHKNMIVHRDLKPENLLLSGDKKSLVISDFGLSTGMLGSRNLLKTRCGTVHYISPEVAKGDPYVGMSSDIWSCGVILYAMVTASLPFDSPTAVGVLKKIVKGEFHMPSYLPKELQDLILKMLTLEPKERIAIPEIKQHTWFTSFNTYKKPTSLNDQILNEEIINVTLQDLENNADIVQNLSLLGWEEMQIKNELLSKENNNAKIFYKLLLNHKSQNPDSAKKVEKEKVEVTQENQEPNATESATTTATTRTKQTRRKSMGSSDKGKIKISRRQSEKRKSDVKNKLPNTQDASGVTPTDKETLPPPKPKEQKISPVIKTAQQVATRSRARSATIGEAQRPAPKPIATPDPVHIPLSKVMPKNEKDTEAGVAEPALTQAPLNPTPTIAENIKPLSQSLNPARGRNRASTLGSGQRPDIQVKKKELNNVTWSISPSQTPNAKTYQVESSKSLIHLLSNLKNVFGNLQGYEVIEKKTKSGIQVKARKSVGSKKPRAQVKIDILTSDDGKNVVSFKKGSKGDKEDFHDVVKTMEQKLDV